MQWSEKDIVLLIGHPGTSSKKGMRVETCLIMPFNFGTTKVRKESFIGTISGLQLTLSTTNLAALSRTKLIPFYMK